MGYLRKRCDCRPKVGPEFVALLIGVQFSAVTPFYTSRCKITVVGWSPKPCSSGSNPFVCAILGGSPSRLRLVAATHAS